MYRSQSRARASVARSHEAEAPGARDEPTLLRGLRDHVRAALSCIVLVGALAGPLTSVHAQQSDPPASLERVRVALQRPQTLGGALIPPEPEERRLGPLTFAPPETRGEFVRVRVPVGALAGRLTHSISAARHRRAERAARVEVARVAVELPKAQ